MVLRKREVGFLVMQESSNQSHTFDCQLYVSARQEMILRMPPEAGPRKIIRLSPVAYEDLFDPAFRRLLATLESVPAPI